MKITIFSEELRKCLNDAGLSDCGENDTWNYWYQRLMNAYDESVERQIMTEQADNAKLRKLAQRMWRLERFGCYGCRRECDAESCYASDCREAVEIEQEMRELEIEVPQ